MVYPKKHLSPTEVSYVGFNSNGYKNDKVIGGFVNFWMIIFLVLSRVLTSYQRWWHDQDPLMSSISEPYSVEGLTSRPSKVYPRDVNTLFFKVHDHSFNTWPIDEIEQYVHFELINVHYSFVDGKDQHK